MIDFRILNLRDHLEMAALCRKRYKESYDAFRADETLLTWAEQSEDAARDLAGSIAAGIIQDIGKGDLETLTEDILADPMKYLNKV